MKSSSVPGVVIRGFMIFWFILLMCHVLFVGKEAIFNFSGSIPPVFFVFSSLFFLVYELVQKRKRIILICISVLMIFLGMTQGDFIMTFKKNDVSLISECSENVKIFNWNTNCWDQYKDQNRFFTFLRKQEADIYLLQEYLYAREWDNPALKGKKFFAIYSRDPFFSPNYMEIDDTSVIENTFPGYNIAVHKQFVTISRYPIIDSYCDPSDQYAVTDINIGGEIIRFFNVHILLHIEPGNPLNPYFYKALEARFAARNEAFTNLKKEIRNTKHDYLIAGDFNSTKAMGVMNSFLKDNIDAACYSNDVIPLTFEYRGLKLWRFDYVLMGKDNGSLAITGFTNIQHRGLSDHNPQLLGLSVQTLSDDLNMNIGMER